MIIFFWYYTFLLFIKKDVPNVKKTANLFPEINKTLHRGLHRKMSPARAAERGTHFFKLDYNVIYFHTHLVFGFLCPLLRSIACYWQQTNHEQIREFSVKSTGSPSRQCTLSTFSVKKIFAKFARSNVVRDTFGR